MSTRPEAPAESGRGGRGARQRIVDAAIRLFYQEGINPTGVERLAAEASVSKRTLYQHFPSKTAVVEEYLRHLRQTVGKVQSESGTGKRGPRSRILALFEAPPTGLRIRGCPFHNAAVESGGAMPEVHHIVEEHKREFTLGLIELARQAGAANPTALGNQLAVLHEGAASLSTSLNDSAPWAHARRAAETLLGDLGRRASVR
jgi:AcrR family transcriptional regulator